MELGDYLRILRWHWRAVVISVVVSVLAVGVYDLTRPKVYSASASGFVTTGSATSPAEASINDSLAKSRVASYVDVATSRGTAEAAKEASGSSATVPSLIGRVQVTQPPETVLIRVTADGPTPQEATDLANAWITALAGEVEEIEGKGGLKVMPQDSAVLPSSPTSPNPQRDLPLALIVGLLIGFGIAVVRNQLDRRIRTPDDLKGFGLSAMATVPASKALARSSGGLIPALAGGTTRVGDPSASEALRKLRTNLRYMDVDDPPKVVVVSSPNEGDGKSTIAVNLAYAMAASGEPTTIVDADLRRPVISSGIGVVEGAGLTDVLIGEATLADVLQEAPGEPNLQVLAAGNIPPNPSEILGSRAMERVLAELSQYGPVIIDAPPLLPVTDGAVLSTHADGVILVVTAGKTLDTHVERVTESLTEVNGRILGVVVNQVSRRESSAYYGGATNYYGASDRSAAT
ncbi:polysaccharide biosynthesis tyrosine autokinase [Janibacter cremeus]|uniref:Capsular exopolysaccharide synthesis family protein n=1 Tax=Janibacter cremeus TaxID=1285192 RepID=A0A852VK07_9MICO|nr:polysaccharide biosynthesis tyrosine autokinase [Janibacter cremeus]NYF97402.1 capsular exopolysaccharide synthesis family protein [Janibacter cremeus]